MKGQQNTQEALFSYVTLESLVPKKHILRKIDRWIDFSMVHEKTKDLYSSTGRPSVDPEVMIRMMTIGYLFGITSERRLCEEVQVNLAYRLFCGLRLEDEVLHHSTFSKNRHGRFKATGLFRDLFYDIVKQAQKRGLVRGEHLTVDATGIKANASLESLSAIQIPYDAEAYLNKVTEENQTGTSQQPSLPQEGKKLSNKTHRSSTDPDARLISKPHDKTALKHSHNIIMDNESRVILDVEVTEPNLAKEGQAAGEMIERTRFVLGINPKTLAGDKAYGFAAAVHRLHQAGVDAYVPLPQQKGPHMEGIFSKDAFRYEAKKDVMICPAGKELHRRTFHKRNARYEYAARKKDCSSCSLKPQCTRSCSRVVHRHLYQEDLDYAARLRTTKEYAFRQRARKKIEMLFGEAKEHMGLRTARRRGREHVLEQCIMTAAVQNMKRIIKAMAEVPPRQAVSCIFTFCKALISRIRAHSAALRTYICPIPSFAI